VGGATASNKQPKEMVQTGETGTKNCSWRPGSGGGVSECRKWTMRSSDATAATQAKSTAVQTLI